MIMDIQKNKARYGQPDNVGPMHSGGHQQAAAQLHKELFSHAQDAFTISEDKIMNQGKVTFKVKQEEAAGEPPSRMSRAGTNQSQKRRGGKAGG
jgi:hypothetical protein